MATQFKKGLCRAFSKILVIEFAFSLQSSCVRNFLIKNLVRIKTLSQIDRSNTLPMLYKAMQDERLFKVIYIF